MLAVLLSARPAEAWHFVYVTNASSNNVSVIDTTTNTVVVTVPLPSGSNPAGIAITPDGKRAYVANGGSNNVSVIDTASNMVVGSPIPVGTSPQGVAVTPDGTRTYVANQGGPPGLISIFGTISVIDTASNAVVATIMLPGERAHGVAITPDGKFAYVTTGNFVIDESDGSVLVIDTASNAVVASTAPPGPPAPALDIEGVAITPDGKHAYVAVSCQVEVGVVDTTTNTVVATIAEAGLGRPPRGSHYAGWGIRLCDGLRCLGHRHGHEHNKGHGPGGD